ncbi:MAG: putative major head protein [Prokaryotic dsDNA virus sp.]|nr:MAG: putative major head protein [Prokaryotic dsDNA virus sp.]|tara:strand:+ start:15197 stop:16162 length:966 start_codon:yes stop_codon:yes gene_type:complete
MADVNNLLTTTLSRFSPKIYEAVRDNNAVLAFLESKGKITDLSGGVDIVESVSITENTNFDWQDPDSNTAVDEVEVLIDAKYDWKYLYGNVVLPGYKIRNNQGKEAKHNLLKALMENAKSTMRNKVDVAMFNDGTNTLAPKGLPALLSKDGTGTVGGIDTSTYELWKNQVVQSTYPAGESINSVTSEQFLADMEEVYNSCVFGTEKIDLVVTTPKMYSKYKAACSEQKRFTEKSQKAADLGFQSLEFNTAAFIFDGNCPDDTMYFLNTDYMGAYFHKDAKFTPTGQAKQFGNDKYATMMMVQMALTVRSRKHHGVLSYVSA